MFRIFIFLSLLVWCACRTPLFLNQSNIELYPIIENGKIGYIDQRGKLRIKPIYDYCEENEAGMDGCGAMFEGEAYGIVKIDGKYMDLSIGRGSWY